ncbi:hypothetical protein HMPREF1393_00640 [Helicobacter pylori GAM103Bi]|nr:hypothetical protein HMPREF1393_00640 [Helicobacter pylori GAM103Bi]
MNSFFELSFFELSFFELSFFELSFFELSFLGGFLFLKPLFGGFFFKVFLF